MEKYKTKFKSVKEIVNEIIKGIMVINKFNNETYYYRDEDNKILRNFVPDEYKYRDFPPMFQEPFDEDKFCIYLTDELNKYEDIYDKDGYIKNMQVIYLDF